MFQVKIQKRIEQIVSILYGVGIWHRESEETVREWRLKLFYTFYYSLLIVSFIAGVLECDNKNDKILTVQFTVMATVVLVKLLYLIWRKKEILELLNRICHFIVEDRETFTLINDTLQILMNFVTIFIILSTFAAFSCSTILPIHYRTERQLFLNIGFPLDWKKNAYAYWLSVAFLTTEVIIVSFVFLLTSIIWYLLANCALRYKALGNQMKRMGEIQEIEDERPMSNAEMDNSYLGDLLEAIASHKNLKEFTNQLNMFFSKVFVMQMATSAFCICGSTYLLAFNTDDNLIEQLIHILILLHSIFDIFMIMYFANEITLQSDRLSYSLFESEWVDRSQSIKKTVLIFGEFLMQPQQLVVLKIYPLTLETFTKILNSAYSMFNILQNLK